MIYLKELHIEEYFLLDKPVHLTFDPKVNYLTGKNGSGKSTLLELIKCVCALTFDEIIDNGQGVTLKALFSDSEASDQSIELEYSHVYKDIFTDVALTGHKSDGATVERQFKMFIRSKAPTIKIEKVNESELSITTDSYSTSTELIPRSYYLSVYRGLITFTQVKYNFVVNIIIYFLYQTHSSRFGEGLSQNEGKIFNSNISVEYSNNGSRDLSADKGQIYVDSSTLYDRIEKLGDFDEYVLFTSKDSVIFQEICEDLGFKSTRLNYHVDSDKKSADGRNLTLSINTLSVILNSGERIQYDQLSYGEKRYLMAKLHWYTSKSVRLYDEPVNGLHHDLIKNFMSWVDGSDCQVFIANQNPVLFDYITFKEDDSFKSQMTFCRSENGEMIWEDPSEQQAKTFMTDYRKEFLNVSTIMKFQELW